MSGYDIQNENRDYISTNHTEFMSVCGGVTGPEIMDPRPWYRIEYQGDGISSCVGNATTGPLEVSYRNKTGKVGQLSRWDAYLTAQKYSDMIQPGFRYFGRDGGALIAGARKGQVERGCCLESTCPYPGGYTTSEPSAAETEAGLYKVGSSSVISSYVEAHTYLESGLGGILIGAPWPFNLTSNNVLSSFRQYGQYGHAWCIIGYLKDLLVAANSHGIGYADKGFFYINQQGFNEMVGNRNVVAVGLSDLTVPRGRKVDWSTESMFA